MKTFSNLFVSLLYIGYFKFIPGTIASIISILILFPLFYFDVASINLHLYFFIAIFILSIFFINKFSIDTKSHDSSIIVVDEFLGIYLIFIFYDYIYLSNPLLTIISIFILFRFFDIFKIFPANIIDRRMNNSLGVLLDDLIASIYTIIILYIINDYN